MTNATKWTVAIFVVILAFALGTLVSQRSDQPVVSGDTDANSHWNHSGSNVFPAAGITNVGINTATPQQPLAFSTGGVVPFTTTDFNIVQNAYGPPNWRYQQNSIRASRFMFNNGWLLFFNASGGAADGPIVWTQRLNISNLGNVGIATPNPTERLHVTGNIKLTGNIKTDGEICIGSGC